MMKRFVKFLLSFTKRDWALSDYPIRVRHQQSSALEPPGRLKLIPWLALVEGWLLSGHGETRETALADLEAAFLRCKVSGKPLPRPGTRVPIKFASTDRVVGVEHVARDFFHRILDMNYDDCLITDESSLWDFHEDESNKIYTGRIQDEYGIDISDLSDARIADILERIAQRRKPA